MARVEDVDSEENDGALAMLVVLYPCSQWWLDLQNLSCRYGYSQQVLGCRIDSKTMYNARFVSCR